MEKKYDPEFMKKIVLEALQENKTVQELAIKHGLSRKTISKLKRKVIDGMGSLLELPNKKLNEEKEKQKEWENERAMFIKTIGEMKIENELLKKNITW